MDVKGLVLTTGVGYDFASSDVSRVNGFGGLRYLDMDTTVNLAVGRGSQRASDDFSNLDAVVSLRGTYALSEKWHLTYYGDVGTGDTDFTSQAALGADYKFDGWSLSFGYRHLEWQDLNDSDTLADVDFSGPFIGAKFNF